MAIVRFVRLNSLHVSVDEFVVPVSDYVISLHSGPVTFFRNRFLVERSRLVRFARYGAPVQQVEHTDFDLGLAVPVDQDLSQALGHTAGHRRLGVLVLVAPSDPRIGLDVYQPRVKVGAHHECRLEQLETVGPEVENVRGGQR